MPSRLIALPFALIAIYLGFQIFEHYRHEYLVYLLICVIILMSIFIMHPQINWLFYRRKPPQIHESTRKWLSQFHPFYKELSLSMKTRFESRFVLYQMANDFIPNGFEKFPDDLKAYISACAIQVNFGHEQYLTEPYNRIVLYPHPFPSPQYPENLHASEIEHEDGVIVLSAEQILQVVQKPFSFYHILIHELNRVFILNHPEIEWPELSENDWADLEKISSMKRDLIEACIGRPDVQILPVAMTLFFVFPWKFKAQRKELYRLFMQRMNLDPTEQSTPIVDPAKAGENF